MVLWSLMVLFFSVRVEPRKSKFFLKFNVSGVFFAFEHVFWVAFCVFWTAFMIKKLIQSINGVNSTIFLFSRFHQISVDVVLCQNTQNIITFMVRWEIFSHLTMRVFRDPERRSGPESQPQIRQELCFTLFYVSSGDFGPRF